MGWDERESDSQQAARHRGQNLINSYSSTNNAQQKSVFGAASNHGGSAKPRKMGNQFERVLPPVIHGKKQSLAAESSLATGLSTRDDSDMPPESTKTSRNQRRDTNVASTRNNTTEVQRKAPFVPSCARRPANAPRYSMQLSNMMNAAIESKSSQLSDARTEEQIEADKVKRQARIKQQHELNSRLSVKKSALGKMLDRQKRKERITNAGKAEMEQSMMESSGYRANGRNR